jgi:DNA replication protein DnaC
MIATRRTNRRDGGTEKIRTGVCYCAAMPNNRRIVFFGNYGCGKTHLAAAIANYQQERGNQVLLSPYQICLTIYV